MKKLLFLFVIVSISLNVFAQETKFGLNAGYLNLEGKIKGDGVSISMDDSGFYVGGFASINIAESIDFQPGVNYASVDRESYLFFPLMFKYNVAEKFNLAAGGLVDWILEDGDDVEGMKKLGLGLALGAGFDVTENISLEAKYSFGLTNRLKDDWGGDEVKVKLNSFQVGIAYKFN